MIKIKLMDLHEWDNRSYRCTPKQIQFLGGLMKHNAIFKKYFCTVNGTPITTTISKKECTKLIDCILNKKEYCLVPIIPKKKEGELKNPIMPSGKFSSDVPKKTFNSSW